MCECMCERVLVWLTMYVNKENVTLLKLGSCMRVLCMLVIVALTRVDSVSHTTLANAKDSVHSFVGSYVWLLMCKSVCMCECMCGCVKCMHMQVYVCV